MKKRPTQKTSLLGVGRISPCPGEQAGGRNGSPFEEKKLSIEIKGTQGKRESEGWKRGVKGPGGEKERRTLKRTGNTRRIEGGEKERHERLQRGELTRVVTGKKKCHWATGAGEGDVRATKSEKGTKIHPFSNIRKNPRNSMGRKSEAPKLWCAC